MGGLVVVPFAVLFSHVLTPIGILLFLFAGWMILHSAVRFFDDSVKLSLTDDGLKDHRTGILIRWPDFRGVRVWIKTVNNSQTAAVMYVKVPDGNGEREIAVDVHSLERSPDDITQLVQKRGLAALQEAASTQSTAEVLIREIRADLDGGIPLSFVINKLVKRGLGMEDATELVRVVAGEGVLHCRQCRLQYRSTVMSCGSCGSELTPATPAEA